MDKQNMRKNIGLAVGAITFLLLLVIPIEGLTVIGQRVLAVTALMAIWWATEALPMSATSLLPCILFPVLGIAGAKVDPKIGINPYAAYFGSVNVLGVGVLLMAASIQKWNLHKIVGYKIIAAAGGKPTRIIFGFAIAISFVSMWISNTTSALMMLPAAIAIATQLHPEGKSNFGKCLALTIPFFASIGGIATLMGSGTNLTAIGLFESLINVKMGFFDWLKIGLPFTIVLLPLVCFFMIKFYGVDKEKTVDTTIFQEELDKMGGLNTGQKWVAAMFFLAVGLWTTRPFWGKYFPTFGDESVALLAGMLPFIIPISLKNREFVLDGKTAFEQIGKNLDLIFIIGGAITIGNAFSAAKVTTWIASGLGFLEYLHPIVIVLTAMVITAFLTEVTSNLVVVAAFLPIMAGIATAAGVEPLPLLMAVSIAGSFAFMLPQGTPPNAIAYATGQIEIADMIKCGFFVKLICIVVFPVVFYSVAAVFGIGS